MKVNEKWKAKFGKRKKLCGLGVSAVKQPRIIDLFFYRRGAEFAEVGPGGAGPYRTFHFLKDKFR